MYQALIAMADHEGIVSATTQAELWIAALEAMACIGTLTERAAVALLMAEVQAAVMVLAARRMAGEDAPVDRPAVPALRLTFEPERRTH